MSLLIGPVSFTIFTGIFLKSSYPSDLGLSTPVPAVEDVQIVPFVSGSTLAEPVSRWPNLSKNRDMIPGLLSMLSVPVLEAAGP